MTCYVKKYINYITALVMVGLAINAHYGVSAVTSWYESYGLDSAWIAGFLIAGSILTLKNKTQICFILGTLPYAIYALSTVWVTIERQAGYAAGIVYAFSYIQLIALYDCQFWSNNND